jgi:hypothetical protein
MINDATMQLERRASRPSQPRSGERMLPTAQAVGKRYEKTNRPSGAKKHLFQRIQIPAFGGAAIPTLRSWPTNY